MAQWALLTPVPIFIPALVAVWRARHLNAAERYIGALMVIAFFTEVVVDALWKVEINNWPVAHVFAPIEFTCITLYYRGQFESRRWRNLLGGLAAAFCVAALVLALTVQGVLESNTIVRSADCGLLIVMSLVLWGKYMRELKHESLASLPEFWINSAVLIYFSGNALLFFFSSSLVQTSIEAGAWLWTVHFAFMTIYYLLFTVGLWKTKRK